MERIISEYKELFGSSACAAETFYALKKEFGLTRKARVLCWEMWAVPICGYTAADMEQFGHSKGSRRIWQETPYDELRKKV